MLPPWIVRWRESHCNSKRTPSILHGLLMERLFILSKNYHLKWRQVITNTKILQIGDDWGIIWFPGCSNFQVISPINVPAFAPPFQARNISAFPFIQLFNLGAGLESTVKGTSWCWPKVSKHALCFFVRMGEPSQGIFTYISLRISQMWVNISWPWILWDRNYNLVCFQIASPHLVDS